MVGFGKARRYCVLQGTVVLNATITFGCASFIYVSVNSYFSLQMVCKVILNIFLWLTYNNPLQAGAYIITFLLSFAHRQLGTFQSC